MQISIHHAFAAAAFAFASVANASPASDAFERLKALAGTWNVTDPSGASQSASYDVIADGSAVVEHLFGMETVYTLDGDSILLTHYCMAHNQPRLRATPVEGDDTLTFEFVDITGDVSQGAMKHMVFSFSDDANKFSQDWTWFGADSSSNTEHFDYSR